MEVYTYVITDRTLKNTVRYAAVLTGDQVLRRHDAPYYYISKVMHKRMGRPVAIKLTIEPITVTAADLFPVDVDYS